MLSLIVCTRDATALETVSQSAAATIGVPYEIVAVDNSHGQYGICEAYNIGAAQARYELLCFMHEDIRFHTSGWGQVVVDTLRDPTIGVLGVTGGLCQLAVPAAWWGCGLNLCRENVLNIFPDGHQEMDLHNPEGVDLTDVAVIDGLWMCSRKEVWQQYPFDAHTFKEFHFYDIDYCTEIFRQGLRVCVTFRLLMEHHSRGSVNSSWVRNALLYQTKRQGQLPFGPVVPPTPQLQALELRALHEFTGRLIRAKFPVRTIASYIGKCLAYNPLNRDTLWLLKLWLRGNVSALASTTAPASTNHFTA
jgi:glycosyltransferase involved in cell wall biosynthesis